MNPKRKFAEALRGLADRLDPPSKTRELQIDSRVADIERLMGFEQTAQVGEVPDWTWTQSSPPRDDGYL